MLDNLIAQRAGARKPARLSDLRGLHHRQQDGRAAPKNARDFIDKIVAASGTSAERDYQTLLQRKAKDVPGATIGELLGDQLLVRDGAQVATTTFDSQSVRPYFPYDEVKQGVLDISAPDVRRHVQARAGRAGVGSVGRVLRDVRAAASWSAASTSTCTRATTSTTTPRSSTSSTGVEGRQIPEAALICNLPGGDRG